MATRKVEKNQWQAYFDALSRTIEATLVEIEVAGMALGDQIEGEWVPLLGIAYDPKDDLIEILLEGMDHLVRHPQEVHVEDGPTGLEHMEIKDAEGNQQILRFKAPLALPAAP